MRRLFALTGIIAPPPPPAVPPLLRDRAARLLATLIRAARETAIANGVRPVPATIQRALRGFFPDALLRKARFASEGADPIAIPGIASTYGHPDALVLGDVVLFRDEATARADPSPWVHALTHAMQFERLGIDGFATRYLEEPAALEQEARDNAARFAAWRAHA